MNEQSADLTAFLSSFDNLPPETKAIALRHILNEENTKDDESTNSTAELNIPEATTHSCPICQKFMVKYSVKQLGFWHDDDGLHERTFKLQEGTLKFSKEALAQGLVRGCVLVQWVFSLLHRGLQTFKAEILQKCLFTVSTFEPDGFGTAIEDLDYISTQSGVTVSLDMGKMYNEEPDYTSKLKVTYDASPFLVDKLWAAETIKNKDYQSYEQSWSGKTSTIVWVSTTQDDPIAPSFPVRKNEADVHSDASFELARQWLEKCQTSHARCNKQTGVMPSRVVDIGTRFPIRSVRLHWTEEGETGKYAALSYCWGGLQPLRSTQESAQDFTDGIMFSKLPKTLQDAMITTFKLGLRYIWIDCLCIIQDDAQDVAREISKMTQTFQEAFVTISAASSRSVHDGFLSSQQLPKDPTLKLPFQTQDGTLGSIYVEKPHLYNAEEDPISLRAWTLQEHILSRRTLMYSTREMWWSCVSATFQGSNNTSSELSQRPTITNSTAGRTPLDQWRSTVRDYTRRFLTYPRDKLPAIAGVANDYSKRLPGKYVAGLWQYSLASELMWSTIRADISRPPLHRAPSWAWPSVDGEISHDWCPLFDLDTLAILQCHVPPLNPSSPFGEVDPSRSVLTVEGEIAPLYWRANKQYMYRIGHNDVFGVDSSVDVGRTQADADEVLPWIPHTMNSRSQDGSIIATDIEVVPIYALVVTRNSGLAETCRGLILVRVEGSEDTYRRVGIFFRCWQEEQCGFERRVIDLV